MIKPLMAVKGNLPLGTSHPKSRRLSSRYSPLMGDMSTGKTSLMVADVALLPSLVGSASETQTCDRFLGYIVRFNPNSVYTTIGMYILDAVD
jgi:hypothetical protein